MMAAAELPAPEPMAAAAECVVPAAVMATAEMHTTEAMTSPAEMAMAPAADMTTAVTSTAVTSASVTSASAAFRQRRARHHGRDHQNGNSNEGLRHGIARCAKPTAFQTTPDQTESSLRRATAYPSRYEEIQTSIVLEPAVEQASGQRGAAPAKSDHPQ
jgi:hypothetical protein